MAAGVAMAIAMAWQGFGYWALVGMAATQALMAMILAWILSGGTPGLPRLGSGVRPMLAFGGFLSASSFLAYVRRHLDNVFIGAHRGTILKMVDVLASVWPPALATLVGISLVVVTTTIIHESADHRFRLMVLAVTFAAGYMSLLCALPHRRLLLEAAVTMWPKSRPAQQSSI